MKSNQPYLIAFLLIWLSSWVYGQMGIKGKVIDVSSGQPITFVSVVLRQLPDSNIVEFTQSDGSGLFSFSTLDDTESSYFLNASFLGYSAQSISVSAQRSFYTFELQQKNLLLNPVEISAELPIVEKGDTTIYKVDQYAQTGERTLEEVLKRMPNVRVDDEGSVFFKNKKIEGIYLDGEDLIGKQYQLATRTLDPSLLEEVQAIENFAENHLLKDLTSSDETILNLTVKEDVKSTFFGNANISASEQRRDIYGNVFSYTGKVKSYAKLSHNNVGIQRRGNFKRLQSAALSPSVNSLSRVESIFNPILSNNVLGSPLENLNNEYVSDVSAVFSPNEKHKVLGKATFFADRNLVNRQFTSTVLSTPSFDFSQRDSISNKLQNLSLDISYQYLPDSTLSLEIQGQHFQRSADINRQSSVVINQIVQDAQPLTLEDQFSQSLNAMLTKRLSTQSALVLNANATWQLVEDELSTFLFQDFQRFLFGEATSSMDSIWRQTVNQQIQVYAMDLSYFQKYNQLRLIYSAGYQYLDYLGSHSTFNTEKYYNNILRLPIHYGFLSVEADLSWKDWQMKSKVRLDYFYSSSQEEHRSLHFPFEVQIAKELSSKTVASLIVEQKVAVPILSTQFDQQYILTDFRSARRGVSDWLLDETFQVNLSFLYTDIMKHKHTFIASVGLVDYSTQWDYARFTFHPLFTAADLISISQNQTLLFNTQFEQLVFPLRGNFRLDANFLSVQQENIINEMPNLNDNRIASIELTYFSVFQFPINFELNFFYRNTSFDLSQVESQGNSIEESNQSVKLLFNKKPISGRLTATRSNFNGTSFYFLDTSFEVLLKSNWTIGISANNLLGTQNYLFQSVDLLANQTTETSYPLLSRFVMLNVSFSF